MTQTQIALDSDAQPTAAHFAEALDSLAQEFPEEAEKIARHRGVILEHAQGGTEPPADASVHGETFGSRPPQPELMEALTPCQTAIGVVVVDVVFFVLGMLGLRAANQRRLTDAILRRMGVPVLNGFARDIRAFHQAGGALAKAQALFTLAGGVFRAGGFRAAFAVLKDEMSWWEWVKTGTIALAQLGVWFATGGAAFAAKAALTVMSAAQLIEDSAKAVRTCS